MKPLLQGPSVAKTSALQSAEMQVFPGDTVLMEPVSAKIHPRQTATLIVTMTATLMVILTVILTVMIRAAIVLTAHAVMAATISHPTINARTKLIPTNTGASLMPAERTVSGGRCFSIVPECHRSVPTSTSGPESGKPSSIAQMIRPVFLLTENQPVTSVPMGVSKAIASSLSALKANAAIGHTLCLPQSNVRPNLKQQNVGVRPVNAEPMSNAEASIAIAPELLQIVERATWSGATGPS